MPTVTVKSGYKPQSIDTSNEAIAKSKTAPRESSFNVIYLPSRSKADIFVMGSDDPFSASVMSRRQLYPVSGLTESGIYIVTKVGNLSEVY